MAVVVIGGAVLDIQASYVPFVGDAVCLSNMLLQQDVAESPDEKL